jgi:geranylgeranyl diphosphate synthase type II
LLTVPVCPGAAQFRQLIRREAERLVPQQLCARVASTV